MRLLLDTHYVVWMIADPARMTRAEHRAITGTDRDLLISPVSIWEIRLKWQSSSRAGRREGALHPEQALAYIAENAITLVDLTSVDCATILSVPLVHRDPFDEQLLIHAQRLNAKLLTRDRLLVGHPLVYRA